MPTLNKLEYLDETKGQIKNALNTKFNAQIQDSDTFRSYVSKINNIYSNWPRVTGENTTLSLTPTKKGKMSLDLKGNSSQDGTPTPDTPSPVKVVTGSNTLVIFGKNLANPSMELGTINTSGELVSSVNQIRSADYINIDNATTLYFKRTGDTKNLKSRFYDENKNFTGAGTPFSTLEAEVSVPTNSRYVKITLDTPNTNYSTDYKLIISKTDEAYEPYQNQTYSISLGSMELCKIADYQDYIYKNGGNWYKHSEIGKVVLNGSETYTSMGWTGKFGCRVDISNLKQTTNINDASYVLSNYYKTYTQNEVANTYNYSIANRVNQSQIAIRNDDFTTATELKTWLSTHNTTVYYVLATPTDTQITDTTLISQLNNIYNANSYDIETNISQTNANLGFIISASALKKGGN